ncbi:615_t:CDS:2 [Acaulospora morrowiae]|uniref:615_t:CDS:1 n=1 Tax=Acaulospora morrowiae TaxID=94023 RepID=A0A9N9DTC4_9GLOM|nr:615_t:CDS:2 [Acaulospora morrowiae]
MWIMNEVILTKGGNLKKPSYKLICKWILQAWEEIPSQMVIKSFLKCGISNADDGLQDHFLYESDESDEEQKREEKVVHLDDESATEIEFNNNEDNSRNMAPFGMVQQFEYFVTTGMVFRSRFGKHDTVQNSFSDLNISWQQIRVLQFLIDAEAGSRFGKHGTIEIVSAICQYFVATGLDPGNMALSEWF